MNFFTLEKHDADFNLTATLTVVTVSATETNVIRWTIEGGTERELGVDREYARDAWRAAKAEGFTEEVDEEEYINEDALYEAAVDAQMSAVYATEPEWAI